MTESEVIVVNGIDPAIYDSVIDECVRYSIISMPFTVNRMKIPNETKRALNIAKGKIAEALFEYFCSINNIPVDFSVCETPFWTVDNRDFIMNNSEWDIKNNFLYHGGSLLVDYNYINLPGLIPNKFSGDQWSKRNEQLINGTKKTEFLFTFLKNADLINGQRGNEFLEINLSHEQSIFITNLYSRYQGKIQSSEPYSNDWFWDEMEKRGEENYFKMNFRPSLIITGYANSDYWDLFSDTGPFDRMNNFQSYYQPRWYVKSKTGSSSFLNGTLWTTITNATTPIEMLPSFLSLFPHLKDNVIGGTIGG